VTLSYPGIGGKPVIIACVECLLTGKGFSVPMLIDTGADETCFPAYFAPLFGHDNKHPEVAIGKDAVRGIGGYSDAYIHSVRVSLIHPSKSTANNPVLAWTSKAEKAPFVDKLESPHGLIGMDIMREWKEIRFAPNKHGVMIRITV
jgi:hypothetical protein